MRMPIRMPSYRHGIREQRVELLWRMSFLAEYRRAYKLPVTFYKDTSDLPEFTDYSMKNRTYRYMEQEALYPFGFGLTYGNVKVSAREFAEQPEKKTGKDSLYGDKYGKWDTEEVVQVYIKDWKSKYAVRNHSLCGFRRVRVKAERASRQNLPSIRGHLPSWTKREKRYVDSNKFSLYVRTTAGCQKYGTDGTRSGRTAGSVCIADGGVGMQMTFAGMAMEMMILHRR